MRLYLLFLALVCFQSSFSQSVQNIRANFDDGKVTITYDLTGGKIGQKYIIEVYGSHNNYQAPLRFVTGDVGKNVLGGTDKRIEWDARNELNNFDNTITFKLKGSLDGTPLSFQNPSVGDKFQIGKNAYLKWEGGQPNQKVKLELVQGGQITQPIGEVNNVGAFTWAIPKGTKKGSYIIRIISGSESAESTPVIIRRKMPLLLIALPVVGIGAAVVILTGGGDSGNNEDLPAAPGPK